MSDPAAGAPPSKTPSASETEERVLRITRELAAEVGGPRAAQIATSTASLERQLGLGSLERVELIARVERAFGRPLDERFLRMDSAAEIAAAVAGGSLVSPAPAAAAVGGVELGAAREIGGRPATLHETLWRRAEADPDRPHCYLREDDGTEHAVTYASLLGEARAVAGGLKERGVRRGETVALMLPTGFDFLKSFQGILIAGAVPVPVYPPVRLDRLTEYAERQAGILADAGVTCMITVRPALPIVDVLRPAVPSLRAVVTADELTALGALWREPEGSPSDPAFIQYTSGSTGQPKGVLLSHANLIANTTAIAAGLAASPSDVGCSWLPLYHDMGLIGSWLFCLNEGLPIDIQSPLQFLARPERWLWTIHRRRATLSGAPNFAYELCARRIPEEALQGLDLSSWRCALNGAEPVSPDTLEHFIQRFEPYGFRREAMMPVYGLAESSVALMFPPAGRGPRVDRVRREEFERHARADAAPADDRTALRFVSVGRALPQHEVRVVDDTGAPVADRVVGRLAFRGPSVTAGYYKNAEATQAIQVRDGFLDSGDLAYAADGELHICGRRKDLIIKGGRNYVPQEIEEATAGVSGIRRGCAVAFGVALESLGTEGLVIVAETRAETPEEKERIAAAVVDRVTAAIGAPPDDVVLVGPGVIPKTPSGKVRRSATRDMYLVGGLLRDRRTPLATRARLLLGALRHGTAPHLKAAARAAYVAWLLLALALPLLTVWLLGYLLPAGHAMRRAEREFLRLALLLGGFRTRVRGVEHLAGGGPFMVVCNHTSYADIAALDALLPLDFLYVAKREVLGWPLVGMYIRKSGHLTVERFDTRESAAGADKLAESIRAGHSVLVFPEGTFTAASGLRPFRLGAFKAAAETRVPILPVVLRGTRRALPDGIWIPRPGRLDLEILPRVEPLGSEWRQIVELRDRVAAAIAEHCGEPRLDLLAGAPVRAATP